MKNISRFYDKAEVREKGVRFAVCLDGRPVRTPGRAPLELPTNALATAIAEEWAGQDEQVRPQTMPLTSLACTAIDHVAVRRDRIVADTAAYCEHDLLCYWAEGQHELVERQRQSWQPLLDWAAETLGARLNVATGILPQAQPSEALKRLYDRVAACDDMTLVALSAAAQAAGSLVVALALVQGRLDAAEAFAVSQLDETYQNELWGQDREALQRRRSLEEDLTAAAHFMALLGEP